MIPSFSFVEIYTQTLISEFYILYTEPLEEFFRLELQTLCVH